MIEIQDDTVSGCANNRKVTYQADFDDCEIWETPLKAFVDFLSAIYGYDISEQITVSTHIKSELFNSTPRNGKAYLDDPSQFFDKDDLK
jgi:hypothetical protein